MDNLFTDFDKKRVKILKEDAEFFGSETAWYDITDIVISQLSESNSPIDYISKVEVEIYSFYEDDKK